jgi:2-keto-4-pentenoate hydratase/2-oxohepta-3-ene-1,7-dioic acid hydratase in catechol pathway
MRYTLATVQHQGKPTPVIGVNGQYWSLAECAPELFAGEAPNLMVLFEDWATNDERLSVLADRLAAKAPAGALAPQPAGDAFLTPLQFPRKVVLMGANYYDHVQGDAGFTDFDKANKVPTLFLKPPTTTLVGSGKSVRYPSQSDQFDWEIELAAIISKRGKHIPVESALDYVAAYTIGIDLSARDWQFDPMHIVKWDLYGGKAFDDSCPLGPTLTPARFVDHKNLQLKLELNGELKQNANTRDMIWSLEEQIAAMSEHVTLEPGDVIMTGTPSGVGLKTGTFMKVGDRLDAEITGLGRLSVEIIPDNPAKAR